MAAQTPKGTLIIIGGHEHKDGERSILEEVAARAQADHSRLVIVTVASEQPEALADEYCAVFRDLGVATVDVLDVREREQANDQRHHKLLERAPVIFFTGGDQLRITSQIGDSVVFRCMRQIYYDGGTIVGASAGAAAMPDTMLVSGPSDESHRISALAWLPSWGCWPEW